MNKKGALKYRHEDEKGVMHYTTYEGRLVALSVHDSKKVEFVNNGGKLEVAFDLKSKDFEFVGAEIVTDKNEVEEVYNLMKEEENTYFTDGFDHLCVIKILR